MIKAIIQQHGKTARIQNFKYASVKDILVGFSAKFGRVHRNTLTMSNGQEVVRWNFKQASVILTGDGVRTQFGYRTVK